MGCRGRQTLLVQTRSVRRFGAQVRDCSPLRTPEVHADEPPMQLPVAVGAVLVLGLAAAVFVLLKRRSGTTIAPE
jgi:hypothetical protein